MRLLGNFPSPAFFFNSQDKWVFTHRTESSIISQILFAAAKAPRKLVMHLAS